MIFNNFFDFSIFLFFYLNVCDAQQSVSVTVKSGQINGISKSVDGNDVNVFLGIPYAQPPIGQLRFRKPLPVIDALESYDATQWPNSCIQPEIMRDTFAHQNFSEDCLYLNIWSPNDVESIDTTELKPVMFWIHGGALALGSSNQIIYNADVLSTKGDVVVVSINYRLNVFGFFYSGTDDAPGNVGLWDQALALEWVNDNIRYFGGDPNKITIFGESAGSHSVGFQLLSPITRNMYQNAIMMSGAVVSSEQIDEPIVSKTKWLNGAKLIGCNDDSSDNEITPKILECLYNIEANSLLKMIELKEVKEGAVFAVYPVIDGVFIPQSPKQLLESGQFKTGANILIGTTEDEGSTIISMFVDPIKYHAITPKNLSYSEAYQELVNIIESDLWRIKINGEEVAKVYFTEISPNSEDYDLLRRTIGIALGDYVIGCPTTLFGKRLYENDRKRSNVYQYHYNTKLSENNLFCSAWMGACHGNDITPVFGLPFLFADNSKDTERVESLQMIDFFTHFARHGYPSQQNGKDWPKYYTIDDNVIAPYFDLKHNKFKNGLKHIECELLFKRYFEK